MGRLGEARCRGPDTRCRGWRKARTGCGEDWEKGRYGRRNSECGRLKKRRREGEKIRRLEDEKVGRLEDEKVGRLEDEKVGR